MLLSHGAIRVKSCCLAIMIYSNNLIEALREELQQFGEMLGRFDDAEAYTTQDSPERSRATAIAILAQQKVVSLTVRRRQEAQRCAASHLGLEETSKLADIIPSLSLERRVLVKALMDENKDLSSRVQQRGELERQLPRRSLHLLQDCFDVA